MAHLVETMAYANAVPWHGLGVPVDDTLAPAEMARAAGLDWEVEKRPVFVQASDGSFQPVREFFNLTRASDDKVLDIVGRGYQPTQNLDAIDFFKRFTEAGMMKMETAGSLDGGRRIWALAATKQGFSLPGNDEVKSYLLLCSPHRLGEALTVRWTGVRVVCNNTLTVALGRDRAHFRLPHYRALDEQMKVAAEEALGLATARMQQVAEQSRLLADTKADEDAVLRYVYQVSGSRILDSVVEEAGALRGGESILDAVINTQELEREIADIRREVREKDLNRTGKMILESILNSPGSDLPSARGTWWGAVNGVTHAVDHKMGRTADGRLTNAWFGERARMKTKALDLAVKYAEVGR